MASHGSGTQSSTGAIPKRSKRRNRSAARRQVDPQPTADTPGSGLRPLPDRARQHHRAVTRWLAPTELDDGELQRVRELTAPGRLPDGRPIPSTSRDVVVTTTRYVGLPLIPPSLIPPEWRDPWEGGDLAEHYFRSSPTRPIPIPRLPLDGGAPTRTLERWTRGIVQRSRFRPDEHLHLSVRATQPIVEVARWIIFWARRAGVANHIYYHAIPERAVRGAIPLPAPPDPELPGPGDNDVADEQPEPEPQCPGCCGNTTREWPACGCPRTCRHCPRGGRRVP